MQGCMVSSAIYIVRRTVSDEKFVLNVGDLNNGCLKIFQTKLFKVSNISENMLFKVIIDSRNHIDGIFL